MHRLYFSLAANLTFANNGRMALMNAWRVRSKSALEGEWVIMGQSLILMNQIKKA